MDETLRQLGELLLGSIPTIILFLVLFGAYRSLVHRRLRQVLSEREARTEGALDRARADIAAAEARTAEYEKKLREARIGIFKVQEERRQKAIQSRAAAVAEARKQAGQQIAAAKAVLAQDAVQAKAGLQAEAERLASEIVESILRQVGAAQHPVGGV